jgi:DEAD/DEAH box helicase domain-containing protein
VTGGRAAEWPGGTLTAMGRLEELLFELTNRPGYEGQVVAWRELPPRPARHAPEALPLSPPVAQALRSQGIGSLYSHQYEAIRAAMAGRHVTVVAASASGKTLCFMVPIAEALAAQPVARALLIYPTKALAQDQLRKLAAFGAGSAFVAETYDGDTPRSLRPLIRRRAQVVLTNPDMLHLGILPYHTAWRDFFRALRYVVLDEMHVYTGIFGAHTANVLRRLRRIVRHYGAEPTFICCSATVGNPAELAQSLTGLPQQLVSEDGSPAGRKLLVLCNPPLLDKSAGRRRSANMEAAGLLAFLVRRGVRTIVFTLSRRQTELILRYAREQLADEGLAERVAAYRAGYLPEQRRAIERQLFAGELLGVVATSALELGIDVGGLDAVIMAGYPGRISSLWQRAGRAGRRLGEALVLLVALPTGVDQYLVAHPDYLLTQENERVLVDPHNPYILAGHLMCATFELPLEPSEAELFGPQTEDLLALLATQGYVMRRQRWYWLDPQTYPAALISLRSVSGAGYDIVVRYPGGAEELLGSIDERAAFAMVHEGAVYLHEGETYLVEKLDLSARRAFVRPAEVDYYTEPVSISHVTALRPQLEEALGDDLRWCFGKAKVTSQVIGYRKRRPVTEQDLGTEPLILPPQEFETQALWIGVGRQEAALLAAQGHDLLGSLHALEHALIAVLPLFALCDPRDIGGASYPLHPEVGSGAVFVYDAYPGGVGIAREAFRRGAELLTAVAEAIEGCPCEAGCPSCVQSPSCGANNQPLDKLGAARLARYVAARRAQARPASPPPANASPG